MVSKVNIKDQRYQYAKMVIFFKDHEDPTRKIYCTLENPSDQRTPDDFFEWQLKELLVGYGSTHNRMCKDNGILKVN